MAVRDFAKFVASQQEAAEQLETDWNEIREEWLSNLDDLYRQVSNFLQEFVTKGSIRYRFVETRLNEENLGSYVAEAMEITIGRQQVFLEPIGTLFIGMKGRVDVVGSAGRAQLALVNENARSGADLISNVPIILVTQSRRSSLPPSPSVKDVSWAWKIVSRGERPGFVELDQEHFFEVLMDVAGA